MKRLFALPIAVLMSLPVAAAGKDRVTKRGDAKPIEGTIEKEDWQGLTIKIESAQSTLTWDKVASIDYADKPLSLVEAEGAYAKGDLAGAADMFSKAADGLKEKPIFLVHALYNAGKCLQGAGKLDDAIKAFEQLNKAVSGHRFFKESYSSLVDCYLQKGDLKGALDAVKGATEAGKALNVEQDFILMMNLREARVLESDKKWAEAQGKFMAVSGGASKYPAVKGEAMLGVARCQMATSPSTAQSTYETITSQFKGVRSVMGPAYAGLGDCLFADAQKSGDQEKLRRAAKAYQDAAVMWFPADGQATGAIETALTSGGECYLLMAQKAANDKARELYATQARSMLLELLEKYPNSSQKGRAGELKAKVEEELAKVPKK